MGTRNSKGKEEERGMVSKKGGTSIWIGIVLDVYKRQLFYVIIGFGEKRDGSHHCCGR